jgi:hypothetical protein
MRREKQKGREEKTGEAEEKRREERDIQRRKEQQHFFESVKMPCQTQSGVRRPGLANPVLQV